MDRRVFLKNSAALAASTALPVSPSGVLASSGQSALPEGQPAHDGYIPPSWLHYSRTIYFEGYTEPVFPYMQEFDAERLVGIVRELGGDTLRFQPLSTFAFYPSKVLPEVPELRLSGTWRAIRILRLPSMLPGGSTVSCVKPQAAIWSCGCWRISALKTHRTGVCGRSSWL
jgi:hypothetical protein